MKTSDEIRVKYTLLLDFMQKRAIAYSVRFVAIFQAKHFIEI